MDENTLIVNKPIIQSKPEKKAFSILKIIPTISGLLGGLVLVTFAIAFVFVRTRALTVIADFERELALIEQTSFVFDVTVDEEIPIDLSWKLSELVNLDNIVPDSVHISETVHVEDEAEIHDNIKTTIAIPFYGNQEITIPVNATVPVSMDIPIDTDISLADVKINDQDIKIQKTVPVKLNMTVEKSIVELGLAPHIEQIKKILTSLKLLFLSTEKTEIGEITPQKVKIEIE